MPMHCIAPKVRDFGRALRVNSWDTALKCTRLVVLVLLWASLKRKQARLAADTDYLYALIFHLVQHQWLVLQVCLCGCTFAILVVASARSCEGSQQSCKNCESSHSCEHSQLRTLAINHPNPLPALHRITR